MRIVRLWKLIGWEYISDSNEHTQSDGTVSQEAMWNILFADCKSNSPKAERFNSEVWSFDLIYNYENHRSI